MTEHYITNHSSEAYRMQPAAESLEMSLEDAEIKAALGRVENAGNVLALISEGDGDIDEEVAGLVVDADESFDSGHIPKEDAEAAVLVGLEEMSRGGEHTRRSLVDTQTELLAKPLGDLFVARGQESVENLMQMLEDPFMGIGINVETGNFDTALMPRSEDELKNAAQDKIRRGEPMTLSEGLRAGGRDTIAIRLGELELQTDAAYRATDLGEIASHLETGYIASREGDEYIVTDDGHDNNGGVDWFLGGVAQRYGNTIIEVPARPDYFQPASDNGTHLGRGAVARHFKSSGHTKPIPVAMANVISKHPITGEYARMTPREFVDLHKGS